MLTFGLLCYPRLVILNGPVQYNFQLLFDEKPELFLHMKCSNTLFALQTLTPYLSSVTPLAHYKNVNTSATKARILRRNNRRDESLFISCSPTVCSTPRIIYADDKQLIAVCTDYYAAYDLKRHIVLKGRNTFLLTDFEVSIGNIPQVAYRPQIVSTTRHALKTSRFIMQTSEC
jgi:hypothetical protein